MARTKQTNRRNSGSSSSSGKLRRMVGGKRPPIVRYPVDDERKGKIRSTPPDLTVVVGSGDEREEFECYKIAMCFACPYFDGEL